MSPIYILRKYAFRTLLNNHAKIELLYYNNGKYIFFHH